MANSFLKWSRDSLSLDLEIVLLTYHLALLFRLKWLAIHAYPETLINVLAVVLKIKASLLHYY